MVRASPPGPRRNPRHGRCEPHPAHAAVGSHRGHRHPIALAALRHRRPRLRPRPDGSAVSLPTTRNTDYTPGSKVKAIDLVDLQDCIVAGKHGDLVLHVAAAWARGTNVAWRDGFVYSLEANVTAFVG